MSWVYATRAFHKQSSIRESAQTPVGQVVTWALASGLLVWHEVSLIGLLAVGLVFVWPDRRRIILSLASVGIVFDYFVVRRGVDLTLSSLTTALYAPGPWLKALVLTCGALLGLYLVYVVAKNFDRLPSPVRRHPYLTLHLGVFGAFALIYAVPDLIILVGVIPWVLWRVSYLIQFSVRGATAKTKFSDHLFYLWPIAGTYSPYGKGLAYLSSSEAKDPLARTASQLAGLKVLVLATLWELVLRLANATIYANGDGVESARLGFNLGLPTLAQAIALEDIGMLTAWASVFLELFRVVLEYAVVGHVIVGVLRLCGFNIFRNTYKPLLSQSIIEFWGRFDYYFKEVMVEFFFYPTFLNGRRFNPQVRLMLAVFAAAFIGNMYFHVLRHSYLIAVGDFQELWATWGPRLVYCLLLAIGIWISMLRQQSARKERASKSTVAYLRSIAGVWLFYAVIRIWNVRGEDITWLDRIGFNLKLLGLSSTGWFG